MENLTSSPIFSPTQLVAFPEEINGSIHNLKINDNGGILAFLPQLPEKPTVQASTVEVYIIPTEKTLFVQGFDVNEYADRPPALLRGCLYIRVLKPTKIRSIELLFRGVQRTEWPEGIPPKRITTTENNEILNHTWPFYQPTGPPLPNNGADMFQELANHHDDSHGLDRGDGRRYSGSGLRPSMSSTSILSELSGGNFLTRALSPVGFVKRAASPSFGSYNDHESDPAIGTFVRGDYIYNFEHPLPPSVPESCKVAFGEVSYELLVNVQRPGAFKSNLQGRMSIDVVRTPSDMNQEEIEPIVISRDWEDQLKYEIVVGAKSIILDTYMPMAFRFIPLWGKVQLHRIRVYLTENLEYYCNNEKVHRIEPQRKFLLLEHKAAKGKSILTKSGGLVEENCDDDDEVLPRELEFQLYVPKDIGDKSKVPLHPDTSITNIQSHHWIKICLRLSKPDPDNSEKRKHYEILIDLPIRVLSPLAAHSNTILPAYDDFIPPIFDTVAAPISPLMSPGVTPIDATLLSQLSHTSLDQLAIERRSGGSTPISFTHIKNSATDEFRDPDMHLNANLYHPASLQNLSEMSSPQATPHPDTFVSPVSSPLIRPIHLLRRPSYSPPPFEADTQPPSIDEVEALPPAYEENELSLSPLRIDIGRGRPRSSTTDSLEVPSPSNNGGKKGMSVKDMLFRQFDNTSSKSRERTRSTENGGNGRNRSGSNSTLLSRKELASKVRHKTPTHENNNDNDLGVLQTQNGSSTATTSCRTSEEETTTTTTTGSTRNSLCSSINNSIGATSLGSSNSGRDRPAIKVTSPQGHSINEEPERSLYYPTPGSPLITPPEEDDLTDIPSAIVPPPKMRALSPIRGPQQQHRSPSRRSSGSSIISTATDIPVELTLPLLAMSTSSLGQPSAYNVNVAGMNHMNGSITSLGPLDNHRRLSALDDLQQPQDDKTTTHLSPFGRFNFLYGAAGSKNNNNRHIPPEADDSEDASTVGGSSMIVSNSDVEDGTESTNGTIKEATIGRGKSTCFGVIDRNAKHSNIVLGGG
ncbi:uncharacterized protein KQ657_004160 [Scheffersomyces spartinae]|uniref:Arrestin C-terminal-like domain-containing protein n=1 Tax=Scheffersomyces spartinae TaxID=45513 RepID=A0A9P8AJR0_9ASCO|nr:uncharacterized protein KQ657_004160 [Scheffersomyces spartinae]KAG7195046.1 hypothetical protein KQ657_004160 [Scheffersomyces spartinae]